MNTQLLHTPEGVRDIYYGECAAKHVLEGRIRSVMDRYGYQSIETPTFEFFEVFRQEGGTSGSKDLYKFFDRDGSILVLRPDFTPSIARVCATALADAPLPIRLCYSGSTFQNHSSYRGELREVTELGAELIGDASVEADAEMIAMITDCMESIGLTDYQISIGQNDFFKSVVKEAGLDEETEETLRELILNRNSFGVEKIVEEKNVPMVEKSIFLKLPELFGGAEILEEAYRLTINERGKEAVNRIRRLYELLQIYHADEHVAFDFSMLGNYDYYTGVTFKVYTYGTGDAVIKGGRYDNLLGKFGKDAPAIGFAVVADELLSALTRQKKPIGQMRRKSVLLYNEHNEADGILLARLLRRQGQSIEMLKTSEDSCLEDYREHAAGAGASYLLEIQEETVVRLLDLLSGSEETYRLAAFLEEEGERWNI